MYFSHSIAKQGTIVKDICYRLGAQFCSACSPSGLIYYGHANWPFRRQRPCANSFIIIMYYEVFSYFFPNTLIVKFQQETIAFWRKKILRHLLRHFYKMYSARYSYNLLKIYENKSLFTPKLQP